ncbi:hypothetical protein VNO77_02738 [Canavalia gladiata]|uniref:Peptidase C1A papain C-terminal domain-containing protein n=1 Tax=Canavalia gladiata TaxID=3824 RepID=A0AAN9MZ49_CANGL
MVSIEIVRIDSNERQFLIKWKWMASSMPLGRMNCTCVANFLITSLGKRLFFHKGSDKSIGLKKNKPTQIMHRTTLNLEQNLYILSIVADMSHDGTKCWLVKNSWGTEWGEERYIGMQRDVNANHGLVVYRLTRFLVKLVLFVSLVENMTCYLGKFQLRCVKGSKVTCGL